MKRDEFVAFVANALDDVVRLAEERSGKPVSRKIAFKWQGSKDEPIRERIVEAIVERVFVDEDHIYPCVDMGVWDILDDGTPLVTATVFNYRPRPFGKNWTEREGPFVRIIGGPFLAKINGEPYVEGTVTGFFIPDMAGLK